MPYFITDESPDCAGWATIKEDGEVIGCHDSKQDAIDQMVAVSIAEGMEPGGERYVAKKIKYKRAEPDELEVGDFVSWNSSGGRARGDIRRIIRDGSINVPDSDFTIEGSEDDPAALIRVWRPVEGGWRATDTLVGHRFSTLTKINPLQEADDRVLPDNYRPALSEDVPEGRACGNCFFYNEDIVQDDMAWCERWSDYVRGDHYCNAWRPDDDDDDDLEDRQVDLDVPQYIRDAAAKGLEYYAEGLAGDGLVAATVREARAMSRGEITEDKVVRASAWGARHAPDLDAPQNSNADNDDFPGAGAVAHYLWGINPLNPAPARAWFDRKSDQIQAERSFNSPAFIANMRNEDSSGVVMKQAVEVREVQFSDIEMRQTEDSQSDMPMTFRGYAAVFNSPSEDMGFREYIKPGAFAKSLRSRNAIRMFLNHNSDIVLASTRAKTLRLVEDDRGLLVDADLPETTAGRDLSVLLQRGDVDSMSFGFSVPPKGESWSDDGSVRELHQVRLHEVSVVTGWPAYPATSATVRSFDVLAERTNTNADELAEAITLLENGKELDAARADLLTEVVGKLRQEPVANLLGIKQKHLDLLAKTL
jgi:HK97 family phage prohead protease